MSFTTTKDRIWVGYNVVAAWLARRSLPVRKAGYSVFGAVLWIAYALPGSKVRATFAALAEHLGRGRALPLFRDYVRGFLRGMNRIEQLRHGYTDGIEAMFRFPEEARLQAMLEGSGVFMVFPHSHATLAMGRGLSQRYPLLALVRSTKNARRAASEREIYENLGCDFVDTRTENPSVTARKVLKALNKRGLVLGTVDRISHAPPEEAPVDGNRDLIRATAFGEAIGIAGWPARFSAKSKAVILPAIVVQTEDEISLRIGEPIVPAADLVATTQDWVSDLERLIRAHPDEWTFALDKHWSRVLRAPAGR